MANRRAVLTGLLAASLGPIPSWADAGSPRYLTAALHASGAYRLCGLSAMGAMLFSLPLPARGHAAAAHPTRPEAIAFARRPGTFALVVDCGQGRVTGRLTAPADRHFYGHGTFSRDGSRLFTTENDLETLEGRIGIWETQDYTRIGDFASGGIGPHDLRRMPGSDVLVVANGGIETHPESGRAKLNLPTMQSNLALLGPDGAVRDVYEVPHLMRLNSLRHLAIRTDGVIAAALQWQGDPFDTQPLLALIADGGVRFLEPDLGTHARFKGYAGSVAFSGDGAQVAITSPRGGVLASFDVKTGRHQTTVTAADVCGVAPASAGFIHSTGTGSIGWLNETQQPIAHAMHSFDNHIVTL